VARAGGARRHGPRSRAGASGRPGEGPPPSTRAGRSGPPSSACGSSRRSVMTAPRCSARARERSSPATVATATILPFLASSSTALQVASSSSWSSPAPARVEPWSPVSPAGDEPSIMAVQPSISPLRAGYSGHALPIGPWGFGWGTATSTLTISNRAGGGIFNFQFSICNPSLRRSPMRASVG
jgi:hypothetical protein